MSEAQEDTRRLILRVADALFARHGYAAVSMSAIVDEMSKVRKVTKGTLYYYFEDKEALFAAVLQEQIMAHGRLIEEAAATGGDLRARIMAIAAAMQRVHPQEFARVRADIDEYLSAAAQRQLRCVAERYLMGPLVEVFARAARDGELRPGVALHVAAMALIGLSGSLSVGPLHAAPLDNAVRAAADLLLNGVAAR